MKKKELLIILILAVLVTLLSALIGNSLCWRGLPCGYYYNLSPRLDPREYGIYCPTCLFPFKISSSATVFLHRLEISLGYHSLDAFFFVDLLFWFVVLTAGWRVVKWTARKLKRQ